MTYCVTYESPLGPLVLVSDGKHLLSVLLKQQLSSLTLCHAPGDDIPVLIAAQRWLDAYFSGQQPEITQLPLKLTGTAFQQAVWRKLLAIPYGETITYGQLAKEIAMERGLQKMSAQAIGRALGANPIIIIVPCHRVLGAGRKLTGYTGGLDIKIHLLQHENIPYK